MFITARADSRRRRHLRCRRSNRNGGRRLYLVKTLWVCSVPTYSCYREKQAFEYGCADGQGPASRRGSHVYEINDWLWNFGRPQPRVRGLSVAKTEESPGLRHPGALGRPGRPANWRHKRYAMYMLGIRLVYTCQIFILNENCILMNAIKSPALVVICTYES